MIFRKRGQISIEYLILVGFISFLIVALLTIAFFYVNNIRDGLKFNELEGYAGKVISSAENVYYSGEPSKITVNAYLPEGVESIDLIDNHLVFNVTTTSGHSVVAFESKAPLEITGDLSTEQGLKRISLEAKTNKVIVTEF